MTTANTTVTATSLPTFSLAAGYINKGINGSHGPNRNMVNNIQGDLYFADVHYGVCVDGHAQIHDHDNADAYEAYFLLQSLYPTLNILVQTQSKPMPQDFLLSTEEM